MHEATTPLDRQRDITVRHRGSFLLADAGIGVSHPAAERPAPQLTHPPSVTKVKTHSSLCATINMFFRVSALFRDYERAEYEGIGRVGIEEGQRLVRSADNRFTSRRQAGVEYRGHTGALVEAFD